MTDQIDTLARTVWGEARSQGREGMLAVAAVIANRVRDPGWWGHDIVSVCLCPWQFSCWNKDDPNCAKLRVVTGADPQFTIAISVAEVVVEGNYVDPTDGADSYYEAATAEPSWAVGRIPTAIIGAHRFYRIGVAPPTSEDAR